MQLYTLRGCSPYASRMDSSPLQKYPGPVSTRTPLRLLLGGVDSWPAAATGNSLRHVLVAHSDERVRRVVSSALPHNFIARPVATMAEALETLTTEKIDLIVADGALCTRVFLDKTASVGLSGRSVFVSSPGCANRLIDGFSRGHAFQVLYESADSGGLGHELRHLLRPRAATRYSIEVLKLTGRAGARAITCDVANVSNHGCAAVLTPSVHHQLLYPGTRIDELRLTANRKIIVSTSGVVRHVKVLSGSNEASKFYIGIEFLPVSQDNEQAEEIATRDPSLVFASLQKALGTPGISIKLYSPNNGNERYEVSSGRVQIEDPCLSVTVKDPLEWGPGDVCRGVFELGGTQHGFWTSVTQSSLTREATHLSLAMPRSITMRRYRGTQRFRPTKERPVTLRVTSPFLDQTIHTCTHDITASGMSFEIDDATDLFPIGTILPRIEIGFPHGAVFVAAGQVRSLHQSDDSDAKVMCGVSFRGTTPTERAELADYVVRCVRPEVTNGSTATFDQIWKFLKDSGFLYAEKLKHLDENEIRESTSTLLGRPNDVFKTWLIHDKGRVRAHISAVRLYSSTWEVQHLAAESNLRGISRARLLTLALTEYCEQHPEIEWARICYRPTNVWPARMFGTFAQRMVDPELSELRTLSYLTASSQQIEKPAGSPGYTVRPFEAADLPAIQAHFISRGRPIQLRSSDLSLEEIALGTVGASFHRIGLTRSREVIVIERDRAVVGFALAEMSSPGLNFSEFTNLATVHLLDDDPVVLKLLCQELRRAYSVAGRRECIVLASDTLVPLLQDLGFEKKKEYACWTWHRTLWRRFYEYALRDFGRN